jgi:hypothetical protein
MTTDNRNKNTHTEAEARKFWRPMVRYSTLVSGVSDAGSNRWSPGAEDREGNPAQSRCIASECAMWRWYAHDADGDRYGNCGLAGD